jgi:ATP-dependent RNA helicase SUPV3L1/SUV3
LPDVHDRLTHPARVKLLWEVCRIPDYRGISPAEHASLLARIFDFLSDRGRVPDDWLAAQVRRLDRPEGDIDTLSKRLAFIRTWTYVAQRAWVDDETHWRGETRAVEDRLSDALHARLTQRFVDRRTSVLQRRLKDRESLVAEVNDKGEVTVEGEFAGRLEGFRFRMDKTASPDEARTLRQASEAALRPHLSLKADRCYNAPDTEFDYTEQGGLMWGDQALGKLVAGPDALNPKVEAFVDEEAGPEVADKVRRRLQHFIDRKISALFEPLLALQKDETLTGLARGFAFRLVEALGILPRDQVASDVKALDQDARGVLRKHGIRFGQYTIFLPALLKPAPTRLRLVLWSLAKGLEVFPESPPPGLVTIPNVEGTPEGSYTMSGYHRAGSRAIRIDMLERLADQIRSEDSRAGFEAKADMLSITGMTLDQFADLMTGLGYAAEKGERVKVKAAEKPREATAEEIHAAAEKRAAEEAARLMAGVEAGAAPESAAGPAPVSAEEIPQGAQAGTATGTPASEEAVGVVDVSSDTSSADAAEPQAEADDRATPDLPAPDPAASEAPVEDAQARDTPTSRMPAAEPPEMESFYSFTWRPKPRERGPRPHHRHGQPAAAAAAGDGKPDNRSDSKPERTARGERSREGQRPRGEGQGSRGPRKDGESRPDRGDRKSEGRFKGDKKGKPEADRSRSFEARPPRREKPIDPDNPFAILASLKDKR